MSKKKIKKKLNNTKVLILVAAVTLLLIIILVALKPEKENKPKPNDTPVETPEIEGNWKKETFSLAGKVYELMADYKVLEEDGWSIKEKSDKTLKSNEKLYLEVELEHEKYKDSKVIVGLVNDKQEESKYKDCKYWAIRVSNDWSETPIEFSLPGGVEYGSTIKEVEKVYGKPKEDGIYYSEALKYYEYTYEIDETILILYIYEDRGLVEFEYRAY